MIKSFASKETKAFFAGDMVKRYQAFAAAAERKLTLLDEAKALDDLEIPMGNKLEALRGDRNGQHSIRHSIRINQQYRLCFRWQDGDAYDVEIVDYH